MFSYPGDDEDSYLSWYSKDFSSVFVATNTFLRLPDFSLPPDGDWIPDAVCKAAKQQSVDVGVSWQKISELCGFPSIAHVNRALRLTGSKRISDEFACPSDTKKMLQICDDNNIVVPDEGRYSPLVDISIARFLMQLGHEELIVADHFETSSRQMKSEALLSPEFFASPQILTPDRSVYISIYIDYHYFLVCQTAQSRLSVSPKDFFEGFFAEENTNDFWGIGDLSKFAISI